jgi:hypothetical protein
VETEGCAITHRVCYSVASDVDKTCQSKTDHFMYYSAYGLLGTTRQKGWNETGVDDFVLNNGEAYTRGSVRK